MPKHFWTKFNWTKYVAKTQTLTLEQHGAYLLLMGEYYMTKAPLSANAEDLFRVCRAFAETERSAVRMVLERFFILKEDGWHQDTCDEELAESKRISDLRSNAGQIGQQTRQQNRSKCLPNKEANAMTVTDTVTDKEKEIREVASLYPKIADPDHLTHEVMHAIGEAIARHGFQTVRDGTRAKANEVKADPSKREFLKDPGKFFRSSDYMLSVPTVRKGGRSLEERVNDETREIAQKNGWTYEQAWAARMGQWREGQPWPIQ